MLAIFDPELEIILEIDSSDYAIGAYVSQRTADRKVHPIAFYSRKLSPAKLNYDIYDKKLLTIIAVF